MSSKIRGVVPPLAIPLKDGELDVPSLERHINRLIEAGLDGLFVSGSTGEVAFSTAERRAQIQREAVRIVDGRIPLLVGVIDTETERVIENIKAVEEIGGATGVVVEEGPAAQLLADPEDPYTRKLLGAAPSLLHPNLEGEM